MDVALLVARVLLVLVFSVAGVTQLADRAGSKKALVDLWGTRSELRPGERFGRVKAQAVASSVSIHPSAWNRNSQKFALSLGFVAS